MTLKGRRMLRNTSVTGRLFLSNRFHGIILKPSPLNSIRTSKVNHLLEKMLHVLLRQVKGECLLQRKARTLVSLSKCFSPLMMNTTHVRKRHTDCGYPLNSEMDRQSMLTPKMQQHSLGGGGHFSFTSKTRPICKTPFNRPETPTTPPLTDRRDKKEVTYYRSSC